MKSFKWKCKRIGVWFFAFFTAVMVVVAVAICLQLVTHIAIAQQVAPTPEAEEEGFNLIFIPLLAVIAIAALLLLLRREKDREDVGDEQAWWATKKGQQFLITLILLVLTILGLVYVGFEALVAAGFLFVAGLAYKYFLGTDTGKMQMSTNEIADTIAMAEVVRSGIHLDSRRGVSAMELPALNWQLVAFRYPPPTRVFTMDMRTGKVTGPVFCGLQEAIDRIYEKRELFSAPSSVVEGRKEVEKEFVDA